MPGSVIVGGARTPIGKLLGAFAGLSAVDLGAAAVRAALERAGTAPDQVDQVYLGQVLQAGCGQMPARQAAVAAGIPLDTPATTINKVCLSGLTAVILADQLIASGYADVVVAGGMESMTNAPYLLPGARGGYRSGNARAVDGMIHDGLYCAFDGCHMGAATESYLAGSISRGAQDRFALASHERAARWVKDGYAGAEIVPVSVPDRRGAPVVIDQDEGIRPDTSIEALGRLAPSFAEGGTITAGNASQLNDGAAAVVVTSRDNAERLGVEPLGEILGWGQVAGPDPSLLTQAGRAIGQAIDRSGLQVGDVDLFEINEAFAGVVLASMAALDVSHDVVNVNGGAIALGHPIGMSGTRLVLTLLHQLRRQGGGVGAAGLCGGGGQGDAIVVRAS